jgi:hypothetical protein
MLKSIDHCIGELAIDDGATKKELELIERSEDDMIDSNHSAEYFMQSENFTLPTSGSFYYFLWIKTSGDSLYKAKFNTTKFAMDFFDTTGTYVCRLDSVILTDSIPSIANTMRSINVDRNNSITGYVKFRRITDNLTTAGSEWKPIITQRRLSNGNAYKKGANTYSMKPEDIFFTAEPNPSHGDVKLTFDIPYDGGVTIEVFNQLGVKVSEISELREFHTGEHQVMWHPTALPSGMYYLRLQYSNLVKVIRVVYIQ